MKYLWLIASFFSLFDTKKTMTEKVLSVVNADKENQVVEFDKQRMMVALLAKYGISKNLLGGSFEGCEFLFQFTNHEHNVEQ